MRQSGSAALLSSVVFLLATPAFADADATGTTVYNTPLRVCADPDAMPYSDRKGEGFENRLAKMAAASLQTTVDYVWFPQRTPGFLRLLQAGDCDVIMGLPDIDGVEMTVSYYRSAYVFVSRADRNLDVDTLDAPVLRKLRIGVHVIGEDGAGTPPAQILGSEGIVDGVVGYPIYGAGLAPSAPVDAVARGELDLAAVWGPIGGYYAREAGVPMRVSPIVHTEAYLPQMFQFPIAMAVRQGDDDLRDRLDAFIRTHRDDIRSLLDGYGVPQLQ